MGTKRTNRTKRNLKGLQAQRRRGMRMLEQGIPQAEAARHLQVGRQTVSSPA